MINIGDKVKFICDNLGELEGVVIKIFKNGKVSVKTNYTMFQGKKYYVSSKVYNVLISKLI
jgi:hypothetical protein